VETKSFSHKVSTFYMRMGTYITVGGKFAPEKARLLTFLLVKLVINGQNDKGMQVFVFKQIISSG